MWARGLKRRPKLPDGSPIPDGGEHECQDQCARWIPKSRLDETLSLAESQSRTEESFRKTDAKIEALADSHKKLAEAQSRTEESLRKLSDTVDRHLREGRNGGSKADA